MTVLAVEQKIRKGDVFLADFYICGSKGQPVKIAEIVDGSAYMVPQSYHSSMMMENPYRVQLPKHSYVNSSEQHFSKGFLGVNIEEKSFSLFYEHRPTIDLLSSDEDSMWIEDALDLGHTHCLAVFFDPRINELHVGRVIPLQELLLERIEWETTYNADPNMIQENVHYFLIEDKDFFSPYYKGKEDFTHYIKNLNSTQLDIRGMDLRVCEKEETLSSGHSSLEYFFEQNRPIMCFDFNSFMKKQKRTLIYD